MKKNSCVKQMFIKLHILSIYAAWYSFNCYWCQLYWKLLPPMNSLSMEVGGMSFGLIGISNDNIRFKRLTSSLICSFSANSGLTMAGAKWANTANS